MGNDYTVDELNEQLKRTNQLLKEAEKRFEGLLKVVTNMNKTATQPTGTYGSSSTDKVFKQAEKKTHEFNKQMDKMLEVRQQLSDQEYDRLDKGRREGQENTRQFILMRRETKMMEESGKMKRKQMSLQAKRIDMMGRLAGGAQGGLAGFIGMGFGTALARGSEASGTAGDKVSGLQERIMNYQNQAGMMEKTAIGTPTGKIQSNMLSRLEKISPKLAKFTYGKEGDDGTRKGGALGKAAGGIGAAGGLIGLAGGAAGGLLGGAIMKGLESSPMFQAISKIMSTAFNLILRPIGDFFSAVFKPISIVLMKWGAVNLRKWAESMNNGQNELMNAADTLGKGIIAFFDDPMATLGAAFQQLAEYMKAAIAPLFAQTYEAQQVFSQFVNTKYNEIDTRLNEELKTIGGSLATGAGVLSGINDTAKRVEEKMTVTDEVAEYMKNVIAPNMSEEKKAGYAAFAGTAWAKSDIGQATGLFDEEGELLKEELGILGENVIESNEQFIDQTQTVSDKFTKNTKKLEQESRSQQQFLTKASNNAQYSAIALEEGFKEIQRRLKALIRAQIKARTTETKEGKADRDLVRTAQLMSQGAKTLDYERQLEKIKSGGRFMQATAGAFGVGVEDFQMMESLVRRYVGEDATKRDWNNAKKLTKELSKLKGMGSKGVDFLTFSNKMKNDIGYEGLTLEQAGAKYYGLASFANGGVISEPVFGIGRSGRSYLLGENGAEKVSPMSGSSNDSVVVNINIAKMSSDVDLNQIKPIVERALLETHARRGII